MAKLENIATTTVNTVPVVIFAVAGGGKLLSTLPADLFEAWGYPRWWAPMTGAVELTAAGLLTSPRTSLVGGSLAMGVLAGAIATHIQHREWSSLAFPLATLAFTGFSVWRRRAASLPVHEPGRRSLPADTLHRTFEGHATGEL